MAEAKDTRTDNTALDEPDWGEDLFDVRLDRADNPEARDPAGGVLQKRTCPDCGRSFEAAAAATGFLACPHCDAVFAASAAVAPAPLASPPPAPAPARATAPALRGYLAIGALFLLVGGVSFVYHRASNVAPRPADRPSAPARPQPRAEPPPVIEVPAPPLEPRPFDPAPRSFQPVRRIVVPPPLTQPPPLSAQPSPPLPLPERVNRAIDRGIAYLRQHHGVQGQYRVYLGLLGLTLLECGASAQDPAVKQIAAWIRSREADLASTYELALAILFLDRLQEGRDRALIRTFGQRLLAGQLDGGTWSYTCPLGQQHRGRAAAQAIPELPQIIAWRNAAPLPKASGWSRMHFRGDNSNTQFGALGLWIAQRYGVAARPALLQTEQYFRQTQSADGSWSYHPAVPGNRDSMTCAGLMSLAMRHAALHGQGAGAKTQQPVQVSDRAINQGLRYLGQSLERIALDGPRIVGVQARDPLYFLWSLERMAVIYGLKTIGDQEWYPWAAEMLVRSQGADGSWRAPYPSPVGTCFALLILKRSNLAPDLQLTVRATSPPGLEGELDSVRKEAERRGALMSGGSSSRGIQQLEGRSNRTILVPGVPERTRPE